MMRKTFSLLLLCLVFCKMASAQNQPAKGQYIRDSILLKTRDGALVTVMTVRKKGVTEKLPTILQFTIYARRSDTLKIQEAADKDYVGVIAYSRGKWNSPGEVLAYETDGRDAYDVIDWISKQPWSDGRVGMYGGSYNGFTQWAATKKLHLALKTIVPSAAVAPGLDVPMTNNVQMSFVFPWTYYTSNNKFLDEKDYRGPQWGDLYWKWYNDGHAYRSLDSLTGRGTNHMFQRWVAHPTYDKYWQDMIPYKKEFANINIPVLTTTGYYDGGQIGGMYYYRELMKHNPKANQYVLIGPYGHFGSQGYPDSVYNGYRIDSAARINIHEVIYQWFDYVFKNKPKPAILKDHFNFEVMGGNEWRHVPSLQQMSTDTLKLYLDNKHLSAIKPLRKSFMPQKIDFANRDGLSSYYYENQIIYDSLNTSGLVFTSDVLTKPLTISGAFSGLLKTLINKKDMDYHVLLFEQMPDGKYFFLSYFMGRASYATSTEKRRLLRPGQVESIPFTNTYITSRRLGKGSKIVIVLNINKSPFEQINYGTGKNVSNESIKDAKTPLQIKWFNDSYINIPVLK
ncbi:CocE/NonD family hydrolase [Mucilaginibacter sp. ZT4R22]|uniref:CocE/NonD family hydrolase n=1 Tax=Mucilaginibacter pankratovii TaxID=2772110 RepID=A0ABR7WM03_9SPHI|nr:CocE/NonD family hydrolase [Mucilaginibacter pankratovii]MBD1363350.1 CocE/NonD family hydrolase [Mucilaginibacter pankratovii]